MIGKISGVTKGVTKVGKEFEVYTIANEKYSAFDIAHQGYSEGELVDFEHIVRGNFKNLVSIKLAGKPAELPNGTVQEKLPSEKVIQPPVFKKGLYGADKDDDIRWQVCLKIASEQVQGEPEAITIYALKLMSLAWVDGVRIK